VKEKVLFKEVARQLKKAKELPEFKKQAVLTDAHVKQIINDYHEMEYIYQSKKYEMMKHFGVSFDEWCFRYNCFPTTFDTDTPKEHTVIDHALVDSEEDPAELTKEDTEFIDKWLQHKNDSVDEND